MADRMRASPNLLLHATVTLAENLSLPTWLPARFRAQPRPTSNLECPLLTEIRLNASGRVELVITSDTPIETFRLLTR